MLPRKEQDPRRKYNDELIIEIEENSEEIRGYPHFSVVQCVTKVNS